MLVMYSWVSAPQIAIMLLDALRSALISSSLYATSPNSHSASTPANHLVPSHHCDCTRSLSVHPRDGKSAGLRNPGKKHHEIFLIFFGSSQLSSSSNQPFLRRVSVIGNLAQLINPW